MFNEALKQVKDYKKQFILFLLSFLLINFTLDYLNLPYNDMMKQHGLYLVLINIILNITMSLISALTLTVSVINIKIQGQDTKSSSVSFLSVLFAVMTYGCTSCVISFLAIFGISYSVALLPLAGLPYKLMTLVILIASLAFTRYELNKPCKVKYNN